MKSAVLLCVCTCVRVCLFAHFKSWLHTDLYLLLSLGVDRKSSTPTRQPIMMLSSYITEMLTWSSLKAVGIDKSIKMRYFKLFGHYKKCC